MSGLPLLSYHARIPRRPAERWLSDLYLALSQNRNHSESLNDFFKRLTTILNQFSLVLFLMRDVESACRSLELQNAFCDSIHGRLPLPLIEAARHQIKINHVRLLRAQHKSLSAEESVRRILDDRKFWNILEEYDKQLYESTRGDALLELCKILVAKNGITDVNELLAITTYDNIGKNIKSAAFECAGIIFLENGETSKFERFFNSISKNEDARKLLKIRYIYAKNPSTLRLNLVDDFKKIYNSANNLRTIDNGYIDHIYYIDYIRKIFENAGARELEINCLNIMEECSNLLRDVPFFCFSKSRKIILNEGVIGNKKFWMPYGSFPIFGRKNNRISFYIDSIFSIVSEYIK